MATIASYVILTLSFVVPFFLMSIVCKRFEVMKIKQANQMKVHCYGIPAPAAAIDELLVGAGRGQLLLSTLRKGQRVVLARRVAAGRRRHRGAPLWRLNGSHCLVPCARARVRRGGSVGSV